MIRIATGLLLLGAGIGLASCQTLSKDECIAADWRVIGEQDGSEGHDPQDRFGKHVKACERAGVVPDQTAWNEGYQRGLFSFCTPLRGLSHGQAGKAYANVCPPSSEGSFLAGYRLGREEYDTQSEIRSLEGKIRSAEFQIESMEDKLDDGKIDERDGERSIARNRADIRDYNRDIGRAEADLGSIRRRIEFFRQNPNVNNAFN